MTLVPAPPPAGGTSLPRGTVPQFLAVAAFLVLAGLAVDLGGRVTARELTQVRDLFVVLVAALLPSDALIRLGRSLFLRGQQDRGAPVDALTATSEMPKATTAQYLAFAAYVVVALLTLVNDTLVTGTELKTLVGAAGVLIGALLPSEATIRFGRALYLRGAPGVTAAHRRLI